MNNAARAICLGFSVLAFAASSPAAENVLTSGNSFFDNENFLAAKAVSGHTFTFIGPAELFAADWSPFTAVWLDGFASFDNFSSSKLIEFAQNGGHLLIENPGMGAPNFEPYPFASDAGINVYTADQGGHASVRIVDPAHPLMSGLTSERLSGWSPIPSATAHFEGDIRNFSILADTGNSAQPVTLFRSVGAGTLVYTDQGFSARFQAVGAEPQAVQFLNNALSVPEPSVVTMLLCGALALAGGARLRRRPR